jgi:uncharacterized protein (TIGR02246 family)
MKRPSRFAYGCLLASILAIAPLSSIAGAPEDIAEDFVRAWNSHDRQQIANLFIDTAYWVPIVGVRLDGRDAIVNDLGTAHATWARRTTMKATDVVVRQLRPDTAVVLFNAPFLDKDGTPVEPANALLIVAVERAEGWRIAVGQLTKPGQTNLPKP